MAASVPKGSNGLSLKLHRTPGVWEPRESAAESVFGEPGSAITPQDSAGTASRRSLSPRSPLISIDGRSHSLRAQRPCIAVHRAMSDLFRRDSTQSTFSVSSLLALKQTIRASFGFTGLDGQSHESMSFERLHQSSLPSLEIMWLPCCFFSSPKLALSCTSIASKCSQFSGFRGQLARASSIAGSSCSRHSLLFENYSSASFAAKDELDSGLYEPCFEVGLSRAVPEVLLEDEGSTMPGDFCGSGVLSTVNSGWSDDMLSFLLCAFIPEIAAGVARRLGRNSFLALKATCKTWHDVLLTIHPPATSLARSLPSEILRQVYEHLAPQDFDSARHVSRNWMSASIDKALLLSMLRRGGWITGILPWLRDESSPREILTQAIGIDTWTLSRCIARECALKPAWRGNGLRDRRSPNCRPAALAETGRVVFEDLACGLTAGGKQQSSGIIFTASTCGKFLCVGEGSMIYIYKLESNTVRPLTSIVCPRRVLAMSLDSGSPRFAIAALLYGRTGLVCTLDMNRDRNGLVRVHDPRLEEWEPCLGLKCDSSLPLGFMAAAEQLDTMASSIDSVDVRNSDNQRVFGDIDTQAGREQYRINQEWNLQLRGLPTRRSLVDSGSCSGKPNTRLENAMPTATGIHHIYRHVGYADDPPRSVAICSQRGCVAFGCSAGIELHWIDATTGQQLTSFFPLSGTSDILYLLPHRIGVDSAKKLRIIASTAHPSERPALAHLFQSGRGWSSNFDWSGPPPDTNQSPVPMEASTLRRDHYGAVPLSDGFHYLFTDAASNLLCLGTDIPLDSPTKLLRKIFFVPPKSVIEASSDATPLPRRYAVTHELVAGPRIAAVYGLDVVLYSVPPDAFRFSTTEQTANGDFNIDESSDVLPDSSFYQRKEMGLDWLEWWPHASLDANSPLSADGICSTKTGKPSNCPWPLSICGTSIGRLEHGVHEISIAETPGAGLTIWAFALDGVAVSWSLNADNKDPHLVSQTIIGPSGYVADVYQLDVFRSATRDELHSTSCTSPDATSTSQVPCAQEKSGLRHVSATFDVTASESAHRQGFPVAGRGEKPVWLRRALHYDNDEHIDRLCVSPTSIYDGDGNILVLDEYCGAEFLSVELD